VINDVVEPTIEQIPPASDLVVEDFNPEIALQNRSVPDPNIREQEKNVTVDPSSSECANVAESLKIKRTDIAASVSTQSTITDTTAASTQESSVIPPQMLFGFATAAADESDSESSEFSE
jgi:hypothetical protein